MEKVNLRRILNSEKLSLSDFDERHILKLMKVACMETLKLASENVVLKSKISFNDDEKHSYVRVDTQSLLDLINLID